MILLRYIGGKLIRNAALLALLLWLIQFSDRISSLAGDSTKAHIAALSSLEKVLIALGRSSPEVLDFIPIIFMLASVATLTTLGRHAELHVIRGAGQSAASILLKLAFATVLASLVVTLAARPLAYEALKWTDKKLSANPSSTSGTEGNTQTVWFSASQGRHQGRLDGFNLSTNQADVLYLLDTTAKDISKSYLIAHQIQLTPSDSSRGPTLTAAMVESAGPLKLYLDHPPKVMLPQNPNYELPLAYLLGWIDDPDRTVLTPRHLSYLIQRAIAEPILSAVLVILAGLLCVELGTRQSVGRLIATTLCFVVSVYSLYVIANAFGINGKSPPSVAAWGPPAVLACFGLTLMTARDLSWHVTVGRRKAEIS